MPSYSRSPSSSPNRRSKERGGRSNERRSYSRERNGRKRSRSQEYRRSRTPERKYRSGRYSPKRYSQKIIPNRKLFLTNIDGKFSEEDVREDIKKQFNQFGEIKNIVVKTKQNSANTYAFIQYEELDDAIKAQQTMKGKMFKGKELKVEFGKGERKPGDRNSKQCYNCHQDGHFARDCQEKKNYRRDKYDDKRRRSRSRDRRYRRRDSRSSSSSRRSYRRRRSYSRDYYERSDKRRDRERDRDRDYRRDREKDYRNY